MSASPPARLQARLEALGAWLSERLGHPVALCAEPPMRGPVASVLGVTDGAWAVALVPRAGASLEPSAPTPEALLALEPALALALADLGFGRVPGAARPVRLLTDAERGVLGAMVGAMVERLGGPTAPRVSPEEAHRVYEALASEDELNLLTVRASVGEIHGHVRVLRACHTPDAGVLRVGVVTLPLEALARLEPGGLLTGLGAAPPSAWLMGRARGPVTCAWTPEGRWMVAQHDAPPPLAPPPAPGEVSVYVQRPLDASPLADTPTPGAPLMLSMPERVALVVDGQPRAQGELTLVQGQVCVRILAVEPTTRAE